MKFQSGINLSAPSADNIEMEHLINLIPENGSLKNIPKPEPLDITLMQGDVILCVHHIPGDGNPRSHYIVANQNSLAYYDHDGKRTAIATIHFTVTEAKPIGNVLVVCSQDNPVTFMVWKAGQYHSLGQQFPQIPLQFMLKSNYEQAFADGNSTGITLEAGPASSQYDYNDIIAPTPMEVNFSTDDIIDIDLTLDPDTSYCIKLRNIDGRGTKVAVTLYAVVNSTTERYLGSDRSRNPEVRFITPGNLDFNTLRVKVTESTPNRRFNMLLIKGTATTTGFYFKNTEENFNALTALANNFIMQYATERNRFIYPFFVRYALRLYDGSYVCPSAPCLMCPSTELAPQVWAAGGTSGGKWDTYTAAVVSELRFRLTDNVSLDAWEGLVDGIAIAVSQPIYSYNMGAEWSAKENTIKVGRTADEAEAYAYGEFDDTNGGFSSQWLFNRNNNLVSNPLIIRLPQFDKTRQAENIRANGIFYIVSEMDIDELPQADTWTTVSMEEHALETLECRRRLDDNPLSLSSFKPDVTAIYNSRLMLGNVCERKFRGYKPGMMAGLAGNRLDDNSVSATLEYKATVKFVEDGAAYQLCELDSSTRNSAPLFWFFYPSVNAKEVVIWRKIYPAFYQRARLQLQPHTTMVGAFWFDNFNQPRWSEPKTYDQLGLDERQELYLPVAGADIVRQNQILQSEVNNPFLFTAARSCSVGDGIVRGMSAAVKALSQGQFGQFPLYVFTSTGIWAMEVGSDGELISKQPVARDPVADCHAILPTDSAVVFATSQGLKIIAGSDVKGISSQLEGTQADVGALLEGVYQPYDHLLANIPDDFNSGVGAYRLAYDYPNNLIHIYIPQLTQAHLVCSLTTGSYAMVSQDDNPDAIVADWPDTIVQQGTALVRYARRRYGQCRQGMLLTRPIPLNGGSELGRLRDLRVLYTKTCDNSSVRTLVLASNNKYRWWPMESLNSHSYRWVRIAIYTNINDHETVDQLKIN